MVKMHKYIFSYRSVLDLAKELHDTH